MQFIKPVTDTLQAVIDSKSLTSSLAGAFFGAWSAYWLNCRAQDKRIKNEQLSFVTYAVSVLAHLISQLYVIKKEIVLPRVEEAAQIKKDLSRASNEQSDVVVKLREQTKFMQTDGMASPVKVEQAAFLAEVDPHIIYLINSLNAGVVRLNQIIYDHNYYLSQIMHANTRPDLRLLADYTQNFEGQTNETLYLAEKAQQVLITFGKLRFKKAFKIKSADASEEWRHLAPPKMDSWESVEWFPKKKCCLVKIKEKVFNKKGKKR